MVSWWLGKKTVDGEQHVSQKVASPTHKSFYQLTTDHYLPPKKKCGDFHLQFEKTQGRTQKIFPVESNRAGAQPPTGDAQLLITKHQPFGCKSWSIWRNSG